MALACSRAPWDNDLLELETCSELVLTSQEAAEILYKTLLKRSPRVLKAEARARSSSRLAISTLVVKSPVAIFCVAVSNVVRGLKIFEHKIQTRNEKHRTPIVINKIKFVRKSFAILS